MNRLALVMTVVLAAAAHAAPKNRATTRPVGPMVLTVAVLDFDCSATDAPELGPQIAEILSVLVSMDDRLVVVERTRMKDLVKEARLSLSGAMDDDKAVRVGKIIGAKLMITGKLVPLGKRLIGMCKIISTETTQLVGFGKRFDINVDHEEMIDALASALVEKIVKAAPRLIPAEVSVTDRVAVVKKTIAAWTLPVVAVRIPERHLPRPIPDPAAQTEIVRILRLCGYEVVDTKGRDDKKKLLGVDVEIKGEAFSEGGGRIEGLISSGCRVELQAVEAGTDKVLIADRHSGSAVHLSEHMAAKSALQKAGHVLGYRLAERLAKVYGKPKGKAGRK